MLLKLLRSSRVLEGRMKFVTTSEEVSQERFTEVLNRLLEIRGDRMTRSGTLVQIRGVGGGEQPPTAIEVREFRGVLRVRYTVDLRRTWYTCLAWSIVLAVIGTLTKTLFAVVWVLGVWGWIYGMSRSSCRWEVVHLLAQAGRQLKLRAL
jgi:hypothetical protein